MFCDGSLQVAIARAEVAPAAQATAARLQATSFILLAVFSPSPLRVSILGYPCLPSLWGGGGGFYYLFLCPDLYPGEAALEAQPPLVGAVVDPAQVRHDRVEGPHVHKVEQLREQLDRQGRVHTALPADQFKIRVEFAI